MAPDLEFAHRLADVADGITTSYLDKGELRAELKPDGSPVTPADLAVEETLRRWVAEREPGSGFLGEEVGATGSGRRRWIVDGIDGTHAFVAGRRQWGTLIAFEEGGEVVVGVASSPGLGRRWWASRGGGAWRASLAGAELTEARRLRVSECASIDAARALITPPPGLNDGWHDSVAHRVAERCAAPSSQGHGPLLVASGEAEASVHLDGGPWDHAPFVVIVEESGGLFSDLWGGRRIDTGTALFSNRATHDAMLDLADPDRS